MNNIDDFAQPPREELTQAELDAIAYAESDNHEDEEEE